jgi:hypothetical protein
MSVTLRFALPLLIAAIAGASVYAAELPSKATQAKAPNKGEPQRHCDIAGFPGVLAANGVCVRLSGYVSSSFNAGQLK